MAWGLKSEYHRTIATVGTKRGGEKLDDDMCLASKKIKVSSAGVMSYLVAISKFF
jgi:hypothetical protein